VKCGQHQGIHYMSAQDGCFNRQNMAMQVMHVLDSQSSYNLTVIGGMKTCIGTLMSHLRSCSVRGMTPGSLPFHKTGVMQILSKIQI
jgi:hypothetical protein